MTTVADDLNDDEDIDFRSLFARLVGKPWWIVGSVFAFTAVSTIVAFVMTPVYRASTVLVAASNRDAGALDSALGQLGGLASMAGISVGSADSETEEALAVLRSRQFTESFINDKGLLVKLFANDWDAREKIWKTKGGVQPSAAKAYRYFNTKIRSAVRDKKTGLVTLQIDWRNREEAAVWANELVLRLNKEMRVRAIEKANASAGFLEQELQSTSNVVGREAIGRLMESQVKQRMLANVTEEYAFRIVDKAMPPDEDDPVRPQKVKIIAGGLFLGLVFGVFVVLLSGDRPVTVSH